jgi:hypothetical protein
MKTQIVAQIIHIPLSFEFSPMRAKWTQRAVEIQGWAKDFKKPSLFFGHLGSSDDVLVDLRDHWALTGLYGMLGIHPAVKDLKNLAVIHWADVPDDIKKIATSAKDMKEIRGLDFFILVCESRESAYPNTGDAWTMRKEFLSMKRDAWSLTEFLRKWGVWDQKKLGSSHLAPGATAGIQNFVVPDGIWELQARYRKALVSSPDEWLCNGIDPFRGAYATPMYPHFILEHYECNLAIEATITIDLLRKVKFRKCKRPDCSEVFALESKHKRLYCGQPCAHLESVREQRRAAARKKAKTKARKGA